jgi:hypothetical protein
MQSQFGMWVYCALRTSHGLMHRIWAKINTAGPLYAAKISVDGDGVKNFRVHEFQKNAAAPFRFNWKNSTYPVVEGNFQTVIRKRFGGNNPNHALILLQRRDFGRRLILTGGIPSLSKFGAVQRGPFEDERLCPAGHIALNHFKSIDVDLDFLALINRVKMRRGVIAENIRIMIP